MLLQLKMLVDCLAKDSVTAYRGLSGVFDRVHMLQKSPFRASSAIPERAFLFLAKTK